MNTRSQIMNALHSQEASETITQIVSDFIDSVESDVSDIKSNLDTTSIFFSFNGIDEAVTGLNKLSTDLY